MSSWSKPVVVSHGVGAPGDTRRDFGPKLLSTDSGNWTDHGTKTIFEVQFAQPALFEFQTRSHLQPLATTRVAASGCKWPQGGCWSKCKWPQVAPSGRKWPQVAASGHKWPQVAASGRKWPQVAASGRKWPQVAASGRKWPQVAASGRKWPQVAASGRWPQGVS